MAKSATSKVDDVQQSLSLVGGRSMRISDAISVAPSLAFYVHDAARAASDLAVDLRQAEAELGERCQRDGVNLNSLKDGSYAEKYGTAANDSLDCWVRVTQLQNQLRRLVKQLDLEFTSGLSNETVLAQLSAYSGGIAEMQAEVVARQQIVENSVDILRHIITNSDDLKRIERESGAGNVFDRHGNREQGDAVINRHRRLADALTPIEATA